MATATSLTQETIIELMAGWESVAVSQEGINAEISDIRLNLATNDARVTEFNDIILPQLREDLAAGSLRIDELNDTVIPDHQLLLDAHTQDLTNLNTVSIPGLQSQIDSNWGWIDELNTTTLPDLQTRLSTLEASGGGFDPTALQAEIDALEARFPITGPDISADAVTANHIASETITAAEIAAGTITALQIAADTITANEIAAGTITADEIAAATITSAEIFAGGITSDSLAVGAVTATALAAGSVTAESLSTEAVTSTHLSGKFIEGVTLDIEDSIFAEPGFLDIKANLMEAESAIFHNNVTRRGTNNYIEGRETASSGVTDPGTPPTVVNHWPEVQLSSPYWGSEYPVSGSVGMTYGNNGEYVSVTGGGSLIAFNPTTGVGRLIYDAGYLSSAYGITRIGDWYYVLVSSFMGDKYTVVRYSALTANEGTLDGTYSMNVVNLYNTTANPQSIALGREAADDSNPNGVLWVVRIDSTTGNYHYRTIDPVTKTSIKPWTEITSGPNPGFSRNIAGVEIGGLLETTLTIWPDNGNSIVYHDTFMGSSELLHDSSMSGRVRPYGKTISAAVGNYSLDTDGKLYTHGWEWDDEGAGEFKYTWYDSDTGGAGVAESLPSPPRTFTPSKGAMVLFKTPLPPDDGSVDAPNTVRAYYKNKQSTRSVFPYVAEFQADELAAGRVMQVPPTGAAAPVTSGFASRITLLPGGYKSNNGDVTGPFWWLYGDGDWRLGDMKRSGALGRFTFPSATAAPSGVYTGLVTFVRTGQLVTATGYIDRASGSNSSMHDSGLRIPVGFRPASNVTASARTAWNSTATYRYRFNADGIVEVQQSAAITVFQAFSESWVTADA